MRSDKVGIYIKGKSLGYYLFSCIKRSVGGDRIILAGGIDEQVINTMLCTPEKVYQGQ